MLLLRFCHMLNSTLCATVTRSSSFDVSKCFWSISINFHSFFNLFQPFFIPGESHVLCCGKLSRRGWRSGASTSYWPTDWADAIFARCPGLWCHSCLVRTSDGLEIVFFLGTNRCWATFFRTWQTGPDVLGEQVQQPGILPLREDAERRETSCQKQGGSGSGHGFFGKGVLKF